MSLYAIFVFTEQTLLFAGWLGNIEQFVWVSANNTRVLDNKLMNLYQVWVLIRTLTFDFADLEEQVQMLVCGGVFRVSSQLVSAFFNFAIIEEPH